MNRYILLILSIIVFYLFYKYIYDGTVYVKSNIDNREYKVRSKNDKQRKADLLAVLYDKLNTIVNTLSTDPSYTNNPDVQRLITNWNKGVSIKEIGNLENDAAYVINKRHMSFCLEDYDSFEYYNLMTYVGIHELAHVMSVEVGHGPEFIKNFNFLLNYSKQLSYLNPFNLQQEPLYIELSKVNTADNYCGVKIANSMN
jgi:hypothetical protein